MWCRRTLMLAAVVAGAIPMTAPALAETGPIAGAVAVDWGRLLAELDAYARYGAERPVASAPQQAAAERTSQPYVQNAGNAWFGVAPRVSFVARDWGGSYRLTGDRLSLVDAMRLSSSTRMVLSRVRFGDFGTTRITPFTQAGFGQWRTDPAILPFMPRATEVAAQLGGGVEVNVARNWQLACETSGTFFIRDGREDLRQTMLWSATLATRMEW